MRRRCVWLVAQACVLVGLVGLPQEASGQAKIAIGIRANTENPTNPNVPYGDPLVFGSLQNPPGLEHWYWGIESHGWVTLPAPPAGGQSVWFVQVKEVRHSVYGVWQGWNARMMTMDNWNAAGTFHWSGFTMCAFAEHEGWCLPSGTYEVDYDLYLSAGGAGSSWPRRVPATSAGSRHRSPEFRLWRLVPEQRSRQVNAKSYQYHIPSPTSQEAIEAIRKATIAYAEVIHNLAPTSREKSVAMTNLETTQMWAIKAVVVNDPDAVVK